MTKKIDRRTIIVGTAAAAAAACAPLPLTAAEADGEIAQLYEAFIDVETRDAAAYDALDQAESDAQISTSLAPGLLWPASVVQGGGIYTAFPAGLPLMDREAIEALVLQLPEAKRDSERSARLQALDEWNAGCAKRRATFNLDALEAAQEAAEEAKYVAWRALMDAPAKSMTGIAIKLAAILHDDGNLQMVWSGGTAGDLSQRMLLAVRADALNLAGLPHTFGIDEEQGEYVEETADGDEA